MPRPKTKSELVTAASSAFDNLTELWDSFSIKHAHAPFPVQLLEHGTQAHWRRDKCLRDVAIHLYEWHNLVIVWVRANQTSTTPTNFFPKPYTWRNYAILNEKFVQQHQDTSYEAARTLLADSHQQALGMIEGFSNDELFTKKHFAWTGTTSLGAYFISATSSHYAWAAKKTRAYAKTLKH